MAGKSAPRPGEIDWLEEAFEGARHITTRRMFGGWGIYGDGLFFALIADGALWLKADSHSDAIWDAAGCPRFTYDFGTDADGRAKMSGSMNYRRAPDETLDDAQAMRHWAELALAAAARVASAKRK